jgi:hypothetical protein
MATGTRKKKSAAEMKAALEAAKKRVAALEAKAYEGELAEAIAASTIVSEFNKIKARYKDISPVNILQAIGKAAKITRVVVTQAEVKKRASKKTAK